ncbi:MAG: pimeloyl-ACP methyl ester esterase BioH [Acidiferrobacteraceae bacterium]
MASVVCIHGWGLNAAIWSATSACLSRSHEVYTPDLPGHGASDTDCPDRLEPLVRMLARDVPDGSVWIGWSFGGEIALATAMMFPHKVARLLLVSTTPRFMQGPDWPHGVAISQWSAFATELAADYDRTLGRFLALQCGGRELGAVRSLRKALLARGRPRTDSLTAALAVMADTDLRAGLEAVRVPALVVHGGRDRIVPVAAGRWLASHLPVAEAMLLPDAGHAPFLTEDAVFCTAAERFLSGS